MMALQVTAWKTLWLHFFAIKKIKLYSHNVTLTTLQKDLFPAPFPHQGSLCAQLPSRAGVLQATKAQFAQTSS